MALIADSKKLLKAHTKAVKQTVEFIETSYIYTREAVNKQIIIEKGCKAIFTIFNHFTTHDNDVYLYTHSLIMNMVEKNRNFKALFNDKIFRDQNQYPIFIDHF